MNKGCGSLSRTSQICIANGKSFCRVPTPEPTTLRLHDEGIWGTSGSDGTPGTEGDVERAKQVASHAHGRIGSEVRDSLRRCSVLGLLGRRAAHGGSTRSTFVRRQQHCDGKVSRRNAVGQTPAVERDLHVTQKVNQVSGITAGNIGRLLFLIRTSGRRLCCMAALVLVGPTCGRTQVEVGSSSGPVSHNT